MAGDMERFMSEMSPIFRIFDIGIPPNSHNYENGTSGNHNRNNYQNYGHHYP